MIRNPKIVRAVALYFLIQFTTSIVYPSVSFALTSGPSQPEFSSFEPVATTNMVDEFSGDFTYNLPLLEVPGPQGSSYPISLSYHSGTSPEEESSWVGYGWTLNPGAINRGTRGLPDDYKDKDVVFHNKMPKNWTGTVGGGVGFGEIFGVELKEIGVDLSATVSLRYNNYRGFGYNAGVGVSLGRGLVSMGYNVSDGSGSYSLNVNPSAILKWNSFQSEISINLNRKRIDKQQDRAAEKSLDKRKSLNRGVGSAINLSGSSYGIFSYTSVSKPNIVSQYKGNSFNVSVSLEGNPVIVPVGASGYVFGSYTYQENVSETTVKGNGFMYAAEASDDHLMDYHVEQEKDFNKRDVFLGIPFNDADNFIVSGEGIGGGFRLHNKTAGHFGPRGVTSNTDIYNIGGEIGAGWTFGPGVDVGKGLQTLAVGNWNRELSKFSKRDDENVDEPVFFRFNNDQGGEWGTNHDDLPFRAHVSGGDNVSLPVDKDKYNIENSRSGRSSYIGYHTNGEIISSFTDNKPGHQAYSHNAYISSSSLSGINPDNPNVDNNLIGEFAIFNEAGSRYVYGLPVYAKNEKNLSYSARGLQSVSENFIGYANAPNESIKVGEEKLSPYATTYLLTEIITPDYIDRGAGGEFGPSMDDLGGYTRFNYNKKTSAYRWRAPFKGMIYNKNSHSDPQDDLVSYSEGDKEIYYLYSIETKTHVAVFKTSERKDGKEAASNAFASTSGHGSGSLEKLDEINLYSIADFQRTGTNLSRDAQGNPILKGDAKAIKTVHFDYDYTLSPGLPNSADSKGKLTLKRVYTEYNGINRVKISPYEFQYAYPTVAEYALFPAKYKANGDNDVVTDYTGLGDQNPSYSFFLADAWGNYQAEGDKRFRNEEPWLDQNKVAGFDPAAWQLKVIKLPSGGEIHVQYEQDDYSFVQDQEAHVMVKLNEAPAELGSNNLYFFDPASVGVTGTADVEALRSMILDRYVTRGKKIYFRFLYRLVGNNNFTDTDEDLKSCNAEFITGYASVRDCILTGNGKLALVLKDEGRLPKDVCKDFVKSQRLGKVYPSQDCDPATGVNDPSNAKALVNQLLSLSKGLLIPGQLCQSLDEKHSYFRIPTPLAKKGGGIRVKRLMMFDTGLEGQSVLYGNEYIYKTERDGKIISSGVAANEPQAMREENILVDFVARKGQNLWSKIVAGKDKEQSEGPIGESILPGASVGYSRVIVRNIHSGKTSPGFSVTDFYTARDYPIALGQPDKEKTMTTIKRTDKNPLPISAPFYTKIDNKTSAAQGFSFVLNSMHGQPRRNASYSGVYVLGKKMAEYSEVNSITYEYFEPGAKVPVMSSLYDGITLKNPGREVDITFSQRKVAEVSNDVNVEADLQLTVIPLAFVVLVIPYPTAVPSFSYIKGELNTHSTTKVVRYPAIVKKTTVVQEGIQHEEENLAFDAYTGKPVAIRSTDEFKGAYLSQNIPASWEYTEMGAKWKSEGKKVTGSFTFASSIVGLGEDPCVLAEFTRGDMIQLGDAAQAVYYITDKDYLNNSLKVEPAANSTPPSATLNQIKIIHTGRTNQLQQQAGAIAMHHEDKQSLAIPQVDQANRYEETTDGGTTRSFAADLENFIKSTQEQTTLTGPYEHLDMSGFADKLTTCTADLTDVTVTELTFLKSSDGQNVKVQLMKFTVMCGNTAVIVKADGWN
ncbi:hypothetical protein [Ohtaekwangia koreensis]|uniref:Uncharacterized protein n=1 Tax=Ohtaekwangia koreensis TaxID=688867 RepID=A0A1T5K792_9BACT|nr:hypothetical protein [Ohtaekwangia koreensis]SKC59328.1 hypothetical protein SAMN05660236_1873 [Ohtaekwangia koreensis]